jgi:hypothetical protein
MAKLMLHRSKQIGMVKSKPMLYWIMVSYSGETCQGCGRKIVTLADLVETVSWPHDGGRIGHDRCFRRAMAKR